ncbi:MAG: hypothetical protein JSW71_08535 [Gemmatimonadota bacterium]|nr:MAG: hypothetical protein JSW71_08535 [Gemmatimonadota bacterium]
MSRNLSEARPLKLGAKCLKSGVYVRQQSIAVAVGTITAIAVGPACSDVEEPPVGFTGVFSTEPRPAYTAIKNQWIGQVEISGNEVFTTDDDYILKDGEPFPIKGIVYVPGYPGYLPWDIENASSLAERLKNSIDRDIAQISAMGANTIRLWGAPRYCYQSVKDAGNLFFLQTLWINTEVSDLHDPQFKEDTKSYIRSVIDRIHSVYVDEPPPLIAYIVGNELSESTILATNAEHPGLNGYAGEHISTEQNLNASEVFLAEMADYVKEYEHDTYGVTHLVSYSNDIRTADIIDTPFLNFRSHNTYSYSVPYYRPGTAQGSVSGTLLQGWIEELKSRFPDRPLLVTETGLSVSPNAPHVGPPNYGYGGNTESEQATGLLQNIEDVETSQFPIAGVIIHEFLDAWWKFGLEDSHSQDPDDIEEWFGIIRLIGNQ